MVSYAENGAAEATISHIPLKMLNSRQQPEKFTLVALVCTFQGNIVGCAIAKGQQGRDYHGFHWTGNECE